jgi:ketosteroid isomerase-like protein
MRMHGLFVAALSLALAAACAQRPAIVPELERDRLQQREHAFLAAMAARDPDAVATHFAADAMLHIANMPLVRGRDAIREFYGNVFRFMAASAATPELIRLADSGDLAYTAGSVANTFQSEQGPVAYAGKYLLVWERRAGDWMIALYSISSNQPEPRR